jgi:hypothetical protein
MRLVEVLQVAGTLLGALASAFMVVEKRLLTRFRRAGATSPDSSIELPRLNFLSRWRLSRLEKANAVVSDDQHRVYLDGVVYGSLRKKRAVRAVTLVVLALAIVILAHGLLG